MPSFIHNTHTHQKVWSKQVGKSSLLTLDVQKLLDDPWNLAQLLLSIAHGAEKHAVDYVQ